MKLILTSESAIKLEAVQEVFSEHRIECFKTKTYLEQPFTQEETYALNMLRVAEALKITRLKLLSQLNQVLTLMTMAIMTLRMSLFILIGTKFDRIFPIKFIYQLSLIL